MEIRSRLRGSRLQRCGLACALSGVAVILQFGLDALLGPGRDPGSYQFFLVAVALSAIWAGRYCALLTLALSILLRLYFFLPPEHSMAIEDITTGIRLILFTGLGAVIAQVGGALYDSEERFSTALRSIGDAVITTDERRTVSFMNPVAESLSGWDAGLAGGRNIEEVLQLIDERTRDKVETPVAVALQSGAITKLREDTALVSRTGSVFAIEDSAAPIRGGSRQPAGAIMVFRDVSVQRSAQKALRESEERYRFLADAVPDFIFTANSKGECDYFNQRWCDYTGLTAEQSRGYSWISALHPDDVSPTLSRWTASVESAHAFEAECRLADKAGSYRAFLMRGLPMLGETGIVQRLFGVFTDIEDYKRTERQFHQAQKMEAIGRLAGGVAHDFNNLLTVFAGYGWMLRNSLTLDTAEWVQADQICRAAEQAAGLTRQLLTFSRRQVVQPVVLDLNDVVTQTEQMLRRLIGEDIEITTSLDSNLAPVLADRSQLVQILMNLSVNARDAMPHGGRLILETSNIDLDQTYAAEHTGVKPGRYVMLAVSDTGAGMDPEIQSHAFEPFFTTKEPGKGTGLGLSTVYGIVSQSGGHVWLYSEPAKGTTIKIYLPPASGNEDVRRPPAEVKPDVSGTETILVAEDQPAVLNLIHGILAPLGYKVLAAGDPAEAIRLCKENAGQIDLLLTDVVMPGMSGQRLAEEATRLRPGLKTLYMSGYSGEVIDLSPHQGIESSLIQKPFTAEQLLQGIRRALDSSPRA